MKKRMETSKKILYLSYILAIILSVVVVIGTFLNYEVSNITTITSLVWGEVATCNIWYLKKSAKENVPKILSSMPEELREQIDINQLLNE